MREFAFDQTLNRSNLIRYESILPCLVKIDLAKKNTQAQNSITNKIACLFLNFTEHNYILLNSELTFLIKLGFKAILSKCWPLPRNN